jgi:hypothetical protein
VRSPDAMSPSASWRPLRCAHSSLCSVTWCGLRDSCNRPRGLQQILHATVGLGKIQRAVLFFYFWVGRPLSLILRSRASPKSYIFPLSNIFSLFCVHSRELFLFFYLWLARNP